MSGNVSKPGASVSQRLLAVLACFDTASKDLSLTEIAALSDLPISTARRLIMELTSWGGLESVPGNRYRIGERLWRIGSLAVPHDRLRKAAMPFMRQLTGSTRETTQLVLLDNEEALVIEKISMATSVPNRTYVGGRLPLHATAVGKCLLAHSPSQFFDRYVKHELNTFTPYTLTRRSELVAEVEWVRRTGYGRSYQEMTLGVSSVAAPIYSQTGELRGAIGVVLRSGDRAVAVAPDVMSAAADISRNCP